MALGSLLSLLLLFVGPAAVRGGPAVTTIADDKDVSRFRHLQLFLNLPVGCDEAYDSLIRQLQRCKTGEDRGHPSLAAGCLLDVDFRSEPFRCDSSSPSTSEAILFPKVGKTQWHPTPECKEESCKEPVPIWSGEDAAVQGDYDEDNDDDDDDDDDSRKNNIINYLLSLLQSSQAR